MMMRVIGENQDDELKDEDPPLIELPSAPHHDFHLPDFHKPDKPTFFYNFLKPEQYLKFCQVFTNLGNQIFITIFSNLNNI